MTRIIMCEGETDLILISYYLEKVKGWVYNSTPKGLTINFTEQENKAACNYQNSNKDELLICAVGGKNNFGNFFNEHLKNRLCALMPEKQSIELLWLPIGMIFLLKKLKNPY